MIYFVLQLHFLLANCDCFSPKLWRYLQQVMSPESNIIIWFVNSPSNTRATDKTRQKVIILLKLFPTYEIKSDCHGFPPLPQKFPQDFRPTIVALMGKPNCLPKAIMTSGLQSSGPSWSPTTPRTSSREMRRNQLSQTSHEGNPNQVPDWDEP